MKEDNSPGLLLNASSLGVTPRNITQKNGGESAHLEVSMANVPGPQPDIKYCPFCRADLTNVPREQMRYNYKRKDGTISEDTHSYVCSKCGKKYEINQDR
jgi:YgiT-type zinc finger domain-containing protein